MGTSIKTTLRIVGVFDPEAVSAALSLAPTRTWRKGDLRGGSPVLRYEEDGWSLTVGERPSLHVDEELAEFFAALNPYADRLRGLLREHRVRAQVCFEVDVEGGENPSIAISASDIARLASLGVSIDIDIV